MADKQNYAQDELDSEQQLVVSSSSENIIANRNSSCAQSGSAKDEVTVGSLINDKYRIVRCIGSGGMGAIFEAEDLALKRKVAIKLLLSSIAQDDRSLRRFQQEAKATSRLNHENIVKVFEFGLHNDSQPYLVMEYVSGTSLADIIKESHRLGVNRTAKLILQIVKGLEHAHQNRVIHRDLKTSNILVSREDDIEVVKIVDFGIAKIAEEGIQSLTSTGEIFGSPFYMSPEQCSGEQLDGRSDIYSLGCVTFECLTGLPPHIGDSALVTLIKHQQEPALSLKEATLGGVFPDDLEHIVAKMLAKSPSDRYSSATALEYELSNFVEGNKFEAAPKDVSAADEFNRSGKVTSFRQFQQSAVPTFESFKKANEQQKNNSNTWLPYLLIAGAGLLMIVSTWAWLVPPKSTKVEQKAASPPVATVSEKDVLPTPEKALQSENAMSDRLLNTYVTKFPNLTKVLCSHTNPSAGQWQKLSLLKNVRILDLSGSVFADEDLAWLSKLPLQKLVLYGCQISGSGLNNIEHIRSLRSLDLTDTLIEDENALTHLNPNLRELSLKGRHHLKDATMTELLRLPGLHTLSLENQDISDTAIPVLSKLKNLEYLDVSNTHLTPDGIKTLQKALPDCVVEYTDRNADDVKIHNSNDG